MSFPVDLSNIFPDKPNTQEEREVTIKTHKLRVVVVRNDKDLYELSVYKTSFGKETKRHWSGGFVTKDVCNFAWVTMLEEFSTIFGE